MTELAHEAQFRGGERVESRVKLGNDRWSVVLRIPFAGMKLSAPSDGSEWRASFCRFTFPAKEASSWSFLRSKHFQLTNDFGKIIFRRDIPCIEAVNANAQGGTVKVTKSGKMGGSHGFFRDS